MTFCISSFATKHMKLAIGLYACKGLPQVDRTRIAVADDRKNFKVLIKQVNPLHEGFRTSIADEAVVCWSGCGGTRSLLWLCTTSACSMSDS